MDKKAISLFSITPYGDIHRFDDTKSIGRVRIFYKGKNRNYSYITDEFASKLISTLPYTPVKGIYDKEEKDFTDHGFERNEGKIYGIVPEKSNFAWEKHLDEDGVEREYACTDCIYFTGIYEEAGTITDKAQSMELYRPSIQGSWKTIDGEDYFVFEDACFLGLQVLGEKVEPCFEGAAFFSLYNDLIKKIEEKEANEVEAFKKEEAAEVIEEKVENTEEVVEAPAEEVTEEVSNEENTEAAAEENVEANVEGAPASEEVVPEANVEAEATEEPSAPSLLLEPEAYAMVRAENENLSTKISELNEIISTLTMERDNALAQVSAFENKVQELSTLCESLSTYKKNIEDSKKLAVIAEYTDKISEEVLETYRQNLDKFSEEDLDMHLFYEMKKASPNIFSTSDSSIVIIPKNNQKNEKSSIERILDGYEKK